MLKRRIHIRIKDYQYNLAYHKVVYGDQRRDQRVVQGDHTTLMGE